MASGPTVPTSNSKADDLVKAANALVEASEVR